VTPWLAVALLLAAESSPDSGRWVTLHAAQNLPDRTGLAVLGAELERAAARIASRIPAAPGPPLVVRVVADHVEQGRAAHAVGAAVPGPEGDLYLVDHPHDRPFFRYAMASSLAGRTEAVRALPVWLRRGAALWLAGDWYGKPYRDWLPRFAAADVLPTADELLASEEQPDGSIPLWAPVAAAVIDRLPGTTLAEKLASPPTRDAVERALAAVANEARRGTPRPLRRSSGKPAFLRGVSLAMANGLEVGYHAPSVEGALDALGRLGANAVSVMPFAAQASPTSPALRYLNRSPGSETDAGLVHVVRAARGRGFSVLYKPHLWVHGSWTGEIRMESEADWQRWFRSYRRYVAHHALLAEWAGADRFSVGVELSRTLERAEEWRRVIAAARQLFSGGMTYSANWYGDPEAVTFWDRLDFIGVDAYYPLASHPEADRSELIQGATAAVATLRGLARRFGKPVVLTEVGFAARKAPWVEPHREGGEYSEEHQALAYEALFAALGRPSWLGGTFVWKAFSGDRGARAGRAGRADFRFLGRQAEEVIRRYYAAGRVLSFQG
jgi:hypothetical protein